LKLQPYYFIRFKIAIHVYIAAFKKKDAWHKPNISLFFFFYDFPPSFLTSGEKNAWLIFTLQDIMSQFQETKFFLKGCNSELLYCKI